MREACKNTFYIRDPKTGSFVPVPAIVGARGPAGGPVWIRYSANEDGTGYTDRWSEGKKYIGIAVGSVPPADETGYTWCKFIGDDGIDGEKGEPGESYSFVTNFGDENSDSTEHVPTTSFVTQALYRVEDEYAEICNRIAELERKVM